MLFIQHSALRFVIILYMIRTVIKIILSTDWNFLKIYYNQFSLFLQSIVLDIKYVLHSVSMLSLNPFRKSNALFWPHIIVLCKEIFRAEAFLFIMKRLVLHKHWTQVVSVRCSSRSFARDGGPHGLASCAICQLFTSWCYGDLKLYPSYQKLHL